LRKGRNGLEGVELYFRKMFVFKVREDLSLPGLECLWVEIQRIAQ
jgi:hypothetical protein